MREGAKIVDEAGSCCGVVTSGGYSPSLAKPVLMTYVESTVLDACNTLSAIVRGKRIPLIQAALPFVKRAGE